MSLERLKGRWYITTACRGHEDGEPCETCWPCTCPRCRTVETWANEGER